MEQRELPIENIPGQQDLFSDYLDILTGKATGTNMARSGKPESNMSSSPLSIRITDDMRMRLSALSRATGQSVSSIVVSAISTYISTMDLTDTERIIYDTLMHDR